jgi:HPt (histidine-containing phosphotransfer) domain-containing protein
MENNNAHAAIDPAAYAAMKTTMGEIFSDVIATFLDYVPQQLDKLDTAIQQADCENIFTAAHSIKSSCSSIGALGVASIAQQIEQLGRNKISAGTEQLYQTLLRQFSKAVAFLEQDRAG